MAENVQCPVCTLYLHAGMNLSDHLETHPKEQVIRALVQMTISGSGVGSNNVLASVLAEGSGGGGGDTSVVSETKKSTTTLEVEEKPLPSDKNTDLNIGSTNNSCSAISISNSTSNCSFSNQSTASSQSSNNAINFNTNTNIEQNIEQERTPSSSPAIPVKKSIKTEPTTTNSKQNKLFNENNDEDFGTKPGFSQAPSANVDRAYHASPAIELSNSNNNQTNFAVFGNQRYEQHHQHRSGLSNQNQLHTPHMPPPPPPPQTTPSQQQIQQHPGQHQEISRNILSLQTHQQSTSGGSFHALQQQQQQLPPPPPPPHPSSLHLGNAPNNHRQSHMFSGQHQPPPNSHHQQNLKVIYTPALPPPPPLQVSEICIMLAC